MIYALVHNEEGSRIIFAATTKSVVKKKLSQIVSYQKRMRTIAEGYHDIAEQIYRQNPIPPLALADLPPLPLVWLDNQWQNQHTINHLNRERERNEEIHTLILTLRDELKKKFKLTDDDIDVIVYRKYDESYMIEEIEDDNSVSIAKLLYPGKE